MRVRSMLALTLLVEASGATPSAKSWSKNGEKITTKHDRDCSSPAPGSAHCSKIFGCTGNCVHDWCVKDRSQQKDGDSKCYWSGSLEAAKCESRGGCLDYSKPLHDCSENCRGPNCRVCVFTCKDVLDKTRAVEAMLMEENAKYELIFDHPDYKCSELPITMPARKSDWPTADCHKDTPFCHKDLDQNDCHGHDTKTQKGGATYFFQGEEFKQCRDAHAAAEKYVKAKYTEVELSATPMDIDDGSCTDTADPDVEWEFEGVKYRTCALAAKAALEKERAARAAEMAQDTESNLRLPDPAPQPQVHTAPRPHTRELTQETWASATAGKSVFVKFLAPWCGHCQAMKPAWDRLMAEFKDSETVVVAKVDCTAGGQSLCNRLGAHGYPTIKYGNPNNLQDYQGGRTHDQLKQFVDNQFGRAPPPSRAPASTTGSQDVAPQQPDNGQTTTTTTTAGAWYNWFK